MRQIKLKPCDSKCERFVLSTQEESFVISGAAVESLGLYSGMELEKGELSALKQAAAAQEVRALAARLLGARPMSRKELIKKLREKGASDETALSAAERMQELGAIDDIRYAGAIAAHYGGRGYGPGRVKQELYQRGIDRELWEEALEQLPDEQDTLSTLIEKRLGTDYSEKDLKRTADYLLRRGFAGEQVRSALRLYGEISEEAD